MNIFSSKRADSVAFQLSPVAAGCAVFLSVLANSSYAQTAPSATATEGVQQVVVSGIRRGIEGAISVKKDSSSIVEAISAEDIGKLPDVSIAEAIARLPGLAAQRVAGRAQVISVRGLSPDFATTLLNGREQVSTGDNRSVEFDQYPSELLSGVTIYKTPDAGIVGQGLSGTIDMQTVRPLSFAGRTIALNARGERNSLGKMSNTKATGNRFSVSYIDQFFNRTLGIAIGYAHLESPILQNETGLYEPWKTDGRPGIPAGTFVTDGAKALSRTGTNERDGIMAVVQFRPSKMWTSTLDMYASKFQREETQNSFEVHLGGYNGNYQPGLQWTPTVVNGVLTGGSASGVYPLVRGLYSDRKDEIKAAGWGNNFKFANWSLLADVNVSRASRKELLLENNLQISNANNDPFLDTVTTSFNSGNFTQLHGTRDYSNPATLYLRNSIYGSGYGKTPTVDDELKGFKLVASIPVTGAMESYFSGVDVGFNVADRTKEKHQPEGDILLKNGPVVIPSDLQYAPVDLGFAGVGMVPTWNVRDAAARFMTFNPSETNRDYLISKQWIVQEKITTSFVKANIDHDFGSVTMRGNVGVQVQHTDQSSQSNYWDRSAPAGSEVKPVDDGKTYTDYLPSLNLAFGLANQQTVRIAAAKQIARPRVDQLRSALDFGVSTTDFKPGGSGGNAQLDPWRAKALDVSYEKYFGTKAYWAAAMFYKKLDTYIYTQTKTYDFSKFTPGTIATTNIGNYTSPFNGKGGTLKGLELSASLPLNMVSKALDGFGVSASGTFSDSSITIDDTGGLGTNITLPGLSKRVSNLTVYYERNGFETRVSQRKRSDFIGEIGNFAADRSLRYVVGETVVDFQIGYSFNEGSLKGLGLLLQVNNVGNEAYQTYGGSKDKPLEFQKYGRTILAGMNYKF
jgi:iron complex outermembrane receptor protein